MLIIVWGDVHFFENSYLPDPVTPGERDQGSPNFADHH
jgi:hypothetical protein